MDEFLKISNCERKISIAHDDSVKISRLPVKEFNSLILKFRSESKPGLILFSRDQQVDLRQLFMT